MKNNFSKNLSEEHNIGFSFLQIFMPSFLEDNWILPAASVLSLLELLFGPTSPISNQKRETEPQSFSGHGWNTALLEGS